MKHLTLFILNLTLTFGLALLPLGQGHAQGSDGTVSLTGVLTIVWSDTQTLESVPPRITLTDEAGNRFPVEISAEVAAPFGGLLRLNGRRITVTGRWMEGVNAQAGKSALLADNLLPEDEGQVGAQGDSVSASALTGSQAWANILCRFKNDPSQPKNVSYINGLFGTTFPGLNHYWREVSYNNINLDGTATYGWYELPYDRNYYLNQGDMLDALARDCTARADSSVHYPSYVGINLMFNADLDGYAWGGLHYLTLDGVSKLWRMTWLPPWGYENQHVLAHEMGHGWGWPHSSGPYSDTYDSQWDVMSSWPPSVHWHATYGALSIHTISYHKDMSGWVPAERIYTANVGSSRSLTLERLSEIPASPGAYLMVKIPIQGSSVSFYTVETRLRKDGAYLNEYEDGLPGQAVIIHKVDETRSDRNAQVVDASINGDPNDAGAMWLPGETFTDSANNISIQILSATTAGYSILVANGQAGNDFYSGATIISSVPYTRYQDTTQTTSQEDDPILSCLGSRGTNSVWFRYTPATAGILSVNTTNSDYDTVLGILTGSPGNFTERGCDDNGGANGASNLSLFVNSNTTYYIEAVGKNGGGNLAFSLNHTPCYSLSIGILPGGSGQVDVSLAPNCNGLDYTKGTGLQITAISNPGFTFDKWSGNASGTINPLPVTINSNITVTANFLPNPPILLAPDNEQIVSSLTPTFDWEEYPGASSHRLQVSAYSNMASPVFNSTVTETQKTLATALKANTRYYWRVQSLVNGVWSKWSETRTFISPNPPQPPVLLTPASGARLNGWRPAYDWSEVILPVPAAGYQIQVARNNLFSDLVWDEMTIASNFDAPEDLEFNSRYYWRVRAHNALNHFGAWTAGRVFYTPPQTPLLLLPADNDTVNSLRPFFDWEDSLNGAKSYTLQIGKDPNFTTLALNITVKTSSLQTVKDLPRLTTLYWRVRATGSYGTGAWSPARTFATPNPPHVPVPKAPLTASIQTTYQPTLDWTDPPADPGTYTVTAGYQVQIASDSLFKNIVIDQTDLTVSEFTPPAALPAGKYYWRVRAYNTDGAYSNWSVVYNFLTPATVSGMISDALTGAPLEGGVVAISGTPLSATSDENGRFSINSVPIGNRKVGASADGRVALAQTLSLAAGKEYVVQFSLLPSNPTSAYRFVLTWDNAGPADLDLHLWLPSTTPAHIHWNNSGDLENFPRAYLHRDDRDASGPETLQIDQLQPGGKYLLAVFRKSDDGTWKNAKAKFQVYQGDVLIATYQAPLSTGAYRWWQVMSIDGASGAITLLNKITATSAAAYDATGGTLEEKP